MKLTKSDIGKKFRNAYWEDDNNYYTLLGITKKGDLLFETSTGAGDVAYNDYRWLPYQKPPARVEAAPAVMTTFCNDQKKITETIFSSEESARERLGVALIAWPAKFDATKGVWYWDE